MSDPKPHKASVKMTIEVIAEVQFSYDGSISEIGDIREVRDVVGEPTIIDVQTTY